MVAPARAGVAALARDTAMDLGHLVGQHVKIARLEVTAELLALSRRARVVGVLAALIGVGYALAMVGLAVLIGGRLAVGAPLLITGLAHIGGAGAALLLVPLRARSNVG